MRITKEQRERFAEEAKSMIDAIRKTDYIGISNYLLSLVLAESIRRGVLPASSAPETLEALRDPGNNSDIMKVGHYHINGIAMLCDISDTDLLDMGCDILSRLQEEQEARNKEAEDADSEPLGALFG